MSDWTGDRLAEAEDAESDAGAERLGARESAQRHHSHRSVPGTTHTADLLIPREERTDEGGPGQHVRGAGPSLLHPRPPI